jgi:flagellar biosynthesis GTPase FlhF
MNGNYEEEDAYTAILSDFKELNESTLGAAIVTQSNASRPESSFQATKPRDPPQVRKQEWNMSEVERLLPAETSNTAEVHAPSIEPLAIREASDANTHQLRTDLGRSGFANTSAVVEKERSFTDNGGQANRDFVTVASNVQRTVSNVSNSAEVRRKLVIVGDTGCGKTALLM